MTSDHSSKFSDEELALELAVACADAGLPVDRFQVLPTQQDDEPNADAVWYRPYALVPDRVDHADSANQPGSLELHRVVVCMHRVHDIVTLAAVLRHEVEHARQWEAHGGRVDDLHGLTFDVLRQVAGGIDGCGGQLINSTPVEIDCNAAASVYIRQRFQEHEVDELLRDDRRRLACSLIGPGPIDALPARMVAFLFVYRAAAEQFASGAPVFRDHLPSEEQAAWDALCASTESS